MANYRPTVLRCHIRLLQKQNGGAQLRHFYLFKNDLFENTLFEHNGFIAVNKNAFFRDGS